MITITRRTARLVRAVVRRALGLSGGSGPSILFQARNDHLRVCAASDDVVAEYRCAGDFDDEQVWVPYECLVACEARNDDPVQFDVRSGHLTVQWRDSSGPQMVQHEVTENGEREPLPETPHELQQNPPALRQALHHAMMTTEREAIRYAVDHIQLRGETGEIVATDGRQLLVQSGFEFPWQENLLVPRNPRFRLRRTTCRCSRSRRQHRRMARLQNRRLDLLPEDRNGQAISGRRSAHSTPAGCRRPISSRV